MILSLIDISGCFFSMFRFERNVRIKPERRINSDYPVKPGNDRRGSTDNPVKPGNDRGGSTDNPVKPGNGTEKRHELYGYQSNGGGRTAGEEREGKRGIKKYFEQKRKNVRFKKCQT